MLSRVEAGLNESLLASVVSVAADVNTACEAEQVLIPINYFQVRNKSESPNRVDWRVCTSIKTSVKSVKKRKRKRKKFKEI